VIFALDGLSGDVIVITKENMIPLLLEASPGFKSVWEEFVKTQNSEPENLPYYICLGDFARYLIEKLDKKDTHDFEAVFQVIEQLHIEGDSYVKNAATVGLLEGIQNIMLNTDKNPDLFRPFLLPETTRWWNKLNDFWEKGKILSDD
jgi:hypothetical protein